MKKVFGFLIVFLMVLCSVGVMAQSADIPNPISTDFIYNNGASYWYTATHTASVVTKGPDTVQIAITPGIDNYWYKSITFQADILLGTGAASAGGSVYVWSSADFGVGYKQIASYSVSTVTPQYYNYTFTGDPGTNYMITTAFTGTVVTTCNYSVLMR